MKKVIDTILELIADTESDWKPSLERAGIYDDVKDIYSQNWSTAFCNKVVAFVVMSYDNESGWIHIHKDRWDNKYKIATRLGMDIKDKKVKDIVENGNHTVNNVVAWYIDHQADWRWDAILSCFEYASEMMRFAKTRTDDKVYHDKDEQNNKIVLRDVDVDKLSAGNLKKGQNIEAAIAQRRKGEELLKEIEEEFVTLNTVMNKEGKRRPTDLNNIDSWEAYIAGLRGYN